MSTTAIAAFLVVIGCMHLVAAPIRRTAIQTDGEHAGGCLITSAIGALLLWCAFWLMRGAA